MSSSSHHHRQSSYAAQSTISELIKTEIQRFESVHPCIYSIYDLLECIPDPLIAQQIRDHVVCIEDSFVNSQEWTLSRAVPDIKLGVVGSLSSGKTALVHRYLTGSYMQDESPEGGRFKKEVVIDGSSYLLLIRDEGGAPEKEFAHWVDALILVFSLENEASFAAVYQFYAKLANHRNTADIPLILVGTQDAISDCRPRVIDDSRARKMAHDLKRCAYFETCATYGLNVEKVFREACSKIIQQKMQAAQAPIPPPVGSCPSTPSHNPGSQGGLNPNSRFHYDPHLQYPHHQQQRSGHGNSFSPSAGLRRSPNGVPSSISPVFAVPAAPGSGASVSPRGGYGNHPQQQQNMYGVSPSASNHSVSSMYSQSSSGLLANHSTPQGHNREYDTVAGRGPASRASESRIPVYQSASAPTHHGDAGFLEPGAANGAQLPTPTSTPTTQRKQNNATRRISNIFKGSKDADDRVKNGECMGSGRAIPIKQGNMYKRSVKSLNKDWKKKFVCLMSDGRLTYYPNIKDYMEDSHGKHIFLGLATVKVPGQQRPKGALRSHTQPITNVPAFVNANQPGGFNKENSVSELSRTKGKSVEKENKGVQLTAYEPIPESRLSFGGYENSALCPSGSEQDKESNSARGETPNVKKKRHARKASNLKSGDLEEAEDCEFVVVSSDQKQWTFEAASGEERDEWVTAIQDQISKSLQGQLSNKRESARAHGDNAEVQALRSRPGNDKCADCGSQNPDWASLNLGALICIECSGIHRNLGSHISRVRSLDLDEWPIEYLCVMESLGNEVVNSIWEHDVRGQKPGPSDSREAKEAWIRSKYEMGAFLAELALPTHGKSLPRQLVDAVLDRNLHSLVLVLAHCQRENRHSPGGTRNDTAPEPVNCSLSVKDRRTPLHLACSVGSPELTQLLIWHNADLRALDQEGRSAVWYAKQGGSRSCLEILANAGLPLDYGIPVSSRLSSAPGELTGGSVSRRGGGGALINGSSSSNYHHQSSSNNNGQTNSSSKFSSFGHRADSPAGGSTSASTNPSQAFEKLPASVI